MKSQALYFTGPEKLELREEPVQKPGPGQLLVQTCLSAISPGTEMLIYRGLAPEDMAVDETIPALEGTFRYPFKYGYSSVGVVLEAGRDLEAAWVGRQVFSFHPHEAYYLAGPAELIPVPPGISVEDAVFLPNMETAVNFLMDGKPMVGEFAGVFGLGVVGLLTTSLLSRFPLEGLVAFDPYPERRQAVCEAHMGACLDPQDKEGWARVRAELREKGMVDGFDLVYELSGAPAALNQAINLTGFSGRVVIGSWYGKKSVQLDLGGRFHRSRIRLVSSQVSTLAPELVGRWTKSRRLGVAWEKLREIHPARWITQRFPIDQAADAYQLLSEKPESTLQVVLSY